MAVPATSASACPSVDRGQETAAIILAGGRARRLAGALPATGGKAACLVKGRPLLSRVFAAVAPVVDHVFTVGGDLPPAVARELPGLIHVPDRQLGAGPLAGLRDGLIAIHQRYQEAGHSLPAGVLLVACDLPWLSAEMLHGLRGRLPENRLATEWVIPVVLDHPQFLCSVLRPTLLDSLQAFLATGKRDLRSFATGLAQTDPYRVVMIPATVWQQSDPTGAAAADIDTPADLEQAQRIAFPAGSGSPYTRPRE